MNPPDLYHQEGEDVTSGPSDGDKEILARLRDGLAAVDAPPQDVIPFAEAALAWRTIDAELAAIEFDSAEQDTVGVRGPGALRALSFETESLSIEFEYDRESRRLIGQIAPVQPARIELHRPGTTSESESDHLGRFSFDGVTSGPISLVFHGVGDPPTTVKTDWTLL